MQFQNYPDSCARGLNEQSQNMCMHYNFIMQSRNLVPLWGITVMKLKQQSDPLTDQMISNMTLQNNDFKACGSPTFQI